MKKLPLVLFLLVTSVFSHQARADMIEPYNLTTLVALETEIKSMTQNLSCETDTDCHAIGYGDKPCGGFKSFLIYSSPHADEDKLIDLVQQYNDEDHRRNMSLGMTSTCDILLEPTVSCQSRQCLAVEPSVEGLVTE